LGIEGAVGRRDKGDVGVVWARGREERVCDCDAEVDDKESYAGGCGGRSVPACSSRLDDARAAFSFMAAGETAQRYFFLGGCHSVGAKYKRSRMKKT